jgi:hypothetical protein
MRKRFFSIFWLTNSIIMIMHLINYFFNQGQGNVFETVVNFLYKNVLPYFNILMTLICIASLIRTTVKAKFVFEREFKYLFLFLLISIPTSPAKTVSDPDFLFYMVTVVSFALVLSFLPVEEIASM